MGACFSSELEVDFTGPVDFNHFHILRAIGKGAFGKVCIVKKRDTKQMYAMKYMNKVQIIKKHAVENVFREINILQTLEHPFLVNLWFTFQDREDIFMVLDLMLGGDLSYHLEKEGRFQVARVRLYVAELALVLEYLRSRHILHRDVKPANMLLDSQGHVHLTDFNVACVVKPNSHITSITGTKPYMAPEVVNSSSDGYLYPVDWWSLGVSAYEMLRGQRPFVIERHTSNEELYTQLRHTRPSASARWDQHTCDVLKLLLHPEEDKRLQSVEKMKELSFFESVNWIEVEEKETTPPFVPPQNRINCDPTYELEEMIVEPNPLHKKQHRLSKRRFKNEDDEMERELDKIERRFKVYSRELEKEKPAEAETGKEAGSSKTEAGDGGDTNSGNKERSPDQEETKEAPEKVQENEKTETVDKVEKESEKPTADEDRGTVTNIDKVTVENEDSNRVEKQEKEMLENQETKDGDKGTVGRESKEEVEVEVHENEVQEETAASVADTSPKGNSTSGEPVPEAQNNLERTDIGLQASEGDSDVSPQMPEGHNLDSFSSVKHLLS